MLHFRHTFDDCYMSDALFDSSNWLDIFRMNPCVTNIFFVFRGWFLEECWFNSGFFAIFGHNSPRCVDPEDLKSKAQKFPSTPFILDVWIHLSMDFYSFCGFVAFI